MYLVPGGGRESQLPRNVDGRSRGRGKRNHPNGGRKLQEEGGPSGADYFGGRSNE